MRLQGTVIVSSKVLFAKMLQTHFRPNPGALLRTLLTSEPTNRLDSDIPFPIPHFIWRLRHLDLSLEN